MNRCSVVSLVRASIRGTKTVRSGDTSERPTFFQSKSLGCVERHYADGEDVEECHSMGGGTQWVASQRTSLAGFVRLDRTNYRILPISTQCRVNTNCSPVHTNFRSSLDPGQLLHKCIRQTRWSTCHRIRCRLHQGTDRKFRHCRGSQIMGHRRE